YTDDTNDQFFVSLPIEFTAGYRINRYISLEAGYLHAGSYDTEITYNDEYTYRIKRSISGSTLAVMLSAPISERTSLFAKLGNSRLTTSVKISDPDPLNNGNNPSTETGSETHSALFYGLGVDIRFTQHWGMALGLNSYEVTDSKDVSRLNTFIAQAKFAF
ncbi:outer membrane beta-barrel protein, partial [Leptospira sp. SA-E8]|uniref:outer membrane beta-barrel protein n=1 Tax=Leptospira sp. SA-E8 TaxID=3422259 RepID=UPI003EBFC313